MGYGFKICGRRHEVYTPPPPRPFDLGLDAIVEKIDQWYAGSITDLTEYFAIGERTYITLPTYEYTRTKSLSSVVNLSAPAATVGVKIIGINHDTLTSSYNGKTKAALTLQMDPYVYSGSQLLNGSPSTAANGLYCEGAQGDSFAWHLSGERDFLNATIFSNRLRNVMPTQFKNRLKAVNKNTRCIGSEGSAYQGATSEVIFLLSYAEISGINPGQESASQYAYYANTSNSYSNGVSAWLRSVQSNNQQYYVDADTRTILVGQSNWLGLGHSFCFCL